MNIPQRPPPVASRPLDPALVAVRNRFVDTLGDRILRLENLKHLIETGGHDPRAVLKAIGDTAHKIAGVAETLGFAEIGQLCVVVDRRILSGTAEQTPCRRLWAEVAGPLEALLDAMEAQLDT